MCVAARGDRTSVLWTGLLHGPPFPFLVSHGVMGNKKAQDMQENEEVCISVLFYPQGQIKTGLCKHNYDYRGYSHIEKTLGLLGKSEN